MNDEARGEISLGVRCASPEANVVVHSSPVAPSQPPSRIIDRLFALVLSTICCLVGLYFAWLAVDMSLPLLQRETFSAPATRRMMLGWALLVVIGAAWLAATMASYGYVYYHPRGSVYSRALRAMGWILAVGVPIQLILAVRVVVKRLPAALWAAAGVVPLLALAAAAAFLAARRLEPGRGQSEAKGDELDSGRGAE